MIAADLIKGIKHSLRTAQGQLGYIHDKIAEEDQAENILLQLKAVQSMLSKTTYELLDDSYRKALAEKISSTASSCPGNCGQENTIESLRLLFPDIAAEDVPAKLREAKLIEQQLKEYLSQKKLDTPSPLN